MQFSKLQYALVGFGLANAAAAHSVFQEFFVNGVGQGPATCVRLNKDPAKASFPIKVGVPEQACGYTGTEGREMVCPVPDGSELSFFWTSYSDDPSKVVIDPGHKGPCAVYLKKVDSAIKDTGVGDGWFKIWDQGYDGKKWCTENLIDNKGYLTVKLPKGLKSGYYLARPELLALHSASSKDNPDPQFYTGCAQIFIQGNGDFGPTDTVSIPGYVKMGEPSVSWNIYYGTDPNDYPVPGPKIATLATGAGAGTAQKEQTEGLRPRNCVFENGNFCASEVPDYTDNKSCWASSEYCWKQNEACWKSAVIGTFDGCKVVESRCKEIGEQCKADKYPGPPNKGKILDLPRHTINGARAPAPSKGTGEDESPAPAASSPAAASSPSGSSSTPETPETPAAPPKGNPGSPSPPQEENEAPSGITEAPAGPSTVTGKDGRVTVYEDVYVTEVMYVTVDVYQKRAAAAEHVRRHAKHVAAHHY